MRRGFGRPIGRGFTPNVPPLLRRANQLMSRGDYADAASALDQLARAAEARGGPRAPFFHIQAGRAYLMGGQISPAMESLERGLGLFATRGQTEKLVNFGTRVAGELSQRGFKKESATLSAYLTNLWPEFQSVQHNGGASKRPALPTHCTGCGAPVHPDEVEWLDEVTAECAYCGTPLRG